LGIGKRRRLEEEKMSEEIFLFYHSYPPQLIFSSLIPNP
jgi:hypothetical protein